ncbi:MAG TPA: FAD-binding oxidoreductase, partial [Chitinophagaceae bacterium]
MSRHFHPLIVKEIRKETADCVSVAFHVPADLGDQFRFTQGQSLTVRKRFGNAEIRRSYSICSSPLEQELRVAIKKQDGGLFSTFANDELRVGDQLEVMPPVGNFYTPLDPSHRKKYVAIAAGSGITPVISIIKTTLALEPESRFTLVYGNRTKSSVIFRETIEGLKDRYMSRLQLIFLLSRERTDTPLNSGRIDIEKLQQLSAVIDYLATDDFFLCGPEQMIFSARDFLASRGVAEQKIHFELFTTPGEHPYAGSNQKATTREPGPESNITVKLDGISFDFKLPYNGDSI